MIETTDRVIFRVAGVHALLSLNGNTARTSSTTASRSYGFLTSEMVCILLSVATPLVCGQFVPTSGGIYGISTRDVTTDTRQDGGLKLSE